MSDALPDEVKPILWQNEIHSMLDIMERQIGNREMAGRSVRGASTEALPPYCGCKTRLPLSSEDVIAHRCIGSLNALRVTAMSRIGIVEKLDIAAG